MGITPLVDSQCTGLLDKVYITLRATQSNYGRGIGGYKYNMIVFTWIDESDFLVYLIRQRIIKCELISYQSNSLAIDLRIFYLQTLSIV